MIGKSPELATQKSKAEKMEWWVENRPPEDVKQLRDLALTKYPPKSQPILITVDHDGFIEVYSEQWRPVTILNLPETDSKESEIAREKMLDKALGNLRDIYWPGSPRIQTGNIRQITMADVLRTEGNLIDLYSHYGPDENRRCGTARKMTLAAMEA